VRLEGHGRVRETQEALQVQIRALRSRWQICRDRERSTSRPTSGSSGRRERYPEDSA